MRQLLLIRVDEVTSVCCSLSARHKTTGTNASCCEDVHRSVPTCGTPYPPVPLSPCPPVPLSCIGADAQPDPQVRCGVYSCACPRGPFKEAGGLRVNRLARARSSLFPHTSFQKRRVNFIRLLPPSSLSPLSPLPPLLPSSCALVPPRIASDKLRRSAGAPKVYQISLAVPGSVSERFAVVFLSVGVRCWFPFTDLFAV